MFPPISHLQFAVLGMLCSAEAFGIDLRKKLEQQHGWRTSLAGFYQLASRLERDGYIEGTIVTERVKDQTLKRRKYHITNEGREVVQETIDFYSQHSVALGIT